MSSWVGASSSSSPWPLRTSSSSSSSSYPSKFFKFHSCPPPSPPPFRPLCLAQSNHVGSDFKFVLHDALDSSGILTSHARDAREGFCSQIGKMSDIERQTSISINRHVDLGKTALYIAAEDDSLVSHSSVPLPVDAFISRFDDLSMDYCSHYNSSLKSSPERLLKSLENYLYIHKGFRRTNARHLLETRALYLHSVWKSALLPFFYVMSSLFMRALQMGTVVRSFMSMLKTGFDTSFRINCNAITNILRNSENASLMGTFGF